MCDSSTVDEAAQQFNNLMALVTDKHAPKINQCIRLNKTPWWDAQCQDRDVKRKTKSREICKKEQESE